MTYLYIYDLLYNLVMHSKHEHIKAVLPSNEILYFKKLVHCHKAYHGRKIADSPEIGTNRHQYQQIKKIMYNI